MEFKLTDRLLKMLHEKNFYGGISVKVMVDSKQVFHKTYGYADLALKKPITENSLFKIMSMTKPMTVATFLMLLEKNVTFKSQINHEMLVLDLDTEIQHLNSAWAKANLVNKQTNLAPNKDITIYHLLTMTSGIGYQGNKEAMELFLLWRTQQINYKTFANKLANVPLHFEPGDAWLYGLNLDLLAALIDGMLKENDFYIDEEKITSWPQLLKKTLLEPLGLKNTIFDEPLSETDISNLVKTSFSKMNDDGKRDLFDFATSSKEEEIKASKEIIAAIDDKRVTETIVPAMTQHPKEMANFLFRQGDLEEQQSSALAGSAIVSNLNDYCRFMQFLLDGKDNNGQIIFSKAYREKMRENHLTKKQLNQSMKKGDMYQNGYGFGVGVKCYDELKVFYNDGAFGWDGMLGSLALADPELNVVIVVMTNSITTRPNVITKIFDTIYDDLYLNGVGK